MTNDQTHSQPSDLAGEADVDVTQVIRGMLADILGVSPDVVTPDALLLELGAQSFDFVELVVRLEKAYDIEIPSLYAIPDRHTVATYVRAVHEGQSSRAAQRPEGIGGD